jgi:hypothetical protein
MCSVRAAFFSRFRNAIIWFVLRVRADTGMPAARHSETASAFRPLLRPLRLCLSDQAERKLPPVLVLVALDESLKVRGHFRHLHVAAPTDFVGNIFRYIAAQGGSAPARRLTATGP